MRLRMPLLAAALALFPALTLNASSTGLDHASSIRARLFDANRWRGHVMVVAHRAGWKENGRTVRAENSLAAVDNAVSLGVEMIEMDVRRSSDGALVIMHDATLERTTTCRGEVARSSLAKLRTCRLVVEGSGIVTREVVPTLQEALAHAKGRILVNIDNKLEPEDLAEIAATARGLDMADGILIKNAIWNEERLERTRTALAGIGGDVAFMPILADDAVRDAGFMAKATSAFAAPAAELIAWHRDAAAPLTTTGGPLFSSDARAAAAAGNWHMWINTYAITDRPEGMVAGGRGDGVAFIEGRPEDSIGFWIARGATIIQTDEPKALIDWLDRHGYRSAYAVPDASGAGEYASALVQQR